ncbi:Hypothetical predicted protein, partial [Cloeon dipterum]
WVLGLQFQEHWVMVEQ